MIWNNYRGLLIIKFVPFLNICFLFFFHEDLITVFIWIDFPLDKSENWWQGKDKRSNYFEGCWNGGLIPQPLWFFSFSYQNYFLVSLFVMYFEFSCCIAKYCHVFKFFTFDMETLVFNACLLLSGLGNQIPTHRKVLSKLEIMIPTKIL